MRSDGSAHTKLRLLVIEDSEDDALLLLHRFRAAGHAPDWRRVDNAADMRTALLEQAWDAVLSDHRMPGFSALGALQLMQELGQDLPFIIVSGVIEEETAVAAMRAGAHDYLAKDKLDRLVPAVEREIREARNRGDKRAALSAVQESESRFRTLVANVPGMVFQLVRGRSGTIDFTYASDGASALLGFGAADIVADSALFLGQLVPEDRDALLGQFDQSCADMSAVNWEGRAHTTVGDQKWINIRCSPRRSDDGRVIWEGVMFNITQSKLGEQALRSSREQLAELSAHLQLVKEEERERIARDIHDELGGTLVAMKFEVALLAGRIPPEHPKLLERARAIERLVDGAIATAGRVARELRPGILKEFGLAAAIECQADDFTQRTALPVSVHSKGLDVEVDPQVSTAVFRVFQETLTNIQKHAEATHVEVHLGRDGDHLTLSVRDDGCGISEADLAKRRSYGLRGMRERIHALEGTILIESGVGQGTRVVVRVPLPEENAKAET